MEIYEAHTREIDAKLLMDLLELLVEAGVLESRDLTNPKRHPYPTCAMKTLYMMGRSPMCGDQEERIKRSHKAAAIEEQLIVAGYNSAIKTRLCPDLRHLVRELRDGSLWPTKEVKKFPSLRNVRHGLRTSTLATIQKHCGSTPAHRISMWMLVSFLDSASQRELLRTSSLIQTPPLPPPKESDKSRGSAHTAENWVVPVLRYWNRDGLPIADKLDNGAGDSDSTGSGDEKGNNSTKKDKKPSIPISTLVSTKDRVDDGWEPASINSAIWSQEAVEYLAIGELMASGTGSLYDSDADIGGMVGYPRSPSETGSYYDPDSDFEGR
ncbi:hypothetical protein PG989_007799 [Apiospora arundinis]